MSILGNMFSKMLGHKKQSSSSSTVTAFEHPLELRKPGAVTPTPSPGASPADAAAPPRMEQVDVAALLDGLAANNSQKLDWRHSIVDMMKLVGMDSSLAQRKALAKELGYEHDMGDTARMNLWLHEQVIRKLADNGGKVPQELLH